MQDFNLYLIGNGFDLSHNLPTKYISFLNTIKSLYDKENRLNSTDIPNHYPINRYSKKLSETNKIENLKYVFGDKNLTKKDIGIKECYEKYNGICNSRQTQQYINRLKQYIEKLSIAIEGNYWFNYFFDRFRDEDLLWIDFEKEIYYVVESFKKILNETIKDDKILFEYSCLTDEQKMLLESFKFFWFNYDGNGGILDKYTTQKYVGSGSYPDKEKIVSTLYNELRIFTELLSIYLQIIDNLLLPQIKKEVIANRISLKFRKIKKADGVISLNYTHTAETLYDISKDKIFYIHGNCSENKQIVLGISSDESDEVPGKKRFIQFKKYAQRDYFNTDSEYLSFIKNLKENKMNNSIKVNLNIIGHSLAYTDQNIIKELFDLADEIKVFCHSESMRITYFNNLSEIYSMSDYEKIKSEKNLSFSTKASEF